MSEPIGYDPTCNLCNIARHNCPGCGADVAHGEIACADCSDPLNYPDCVMCASGWHYGTADDGVTCDCCGQPFTLPGRDAGGRA